MILMLIDITEINKWKLCILKHLTGPYWIHNAFLSTFDRPDETVEETEREKEKKKINKSLLQVPLVLALSHKCCPLG